MTAESRFIAALRALVHDEGARDLLDDAAILEPPLGRLVLTSDMIAEGVHFLEGDPPEDVAWKLVAVNLSDLAAKGSRPMGVLLGYSLSEAGWDAAFVRGLGLALEAFGVKLLGGDTIALPPGAPRVLSITAFGEASGPVPDRRGAKAGDHLWVTGTIGDAGAGLGQLRAGERAGPLVERYRQPRPRLEAGERLAPLVHAMMDVSDGLLIDAARLAAASRCALRLELDAIPLSAEALGWFGDTLPGRIEAGRAGDDYELLFTAPAAAAPGLLDLSDEIGLPMTRIGRFGEGQGLALEAAGRPVPLPETLGYEHRR